MLLEPGPIPHRGEEIETPVPSLIAPQRVMGKPDLPSNHELTSQLQAFWELESLGIVRSNKSVHDMSKENISYKEGRYEVSLQWKEVQDALLHNYVLSLRRLQGLIRRLRQTPKLLEQYDAAIKDELRREIVELVPSSESVSQSQVYYLPHHAVIRQDKETTELQVVYDASARSDGALLNDCLYTGPKFNQKILDILIHFCSYRVALTADIKKGFLMISVKSSDRDVLRFLWVDNIDEEQLKFVALRFTRVVLGVSSTLFC